MAELSKSDWKLFRERVPKWQERYMERLTREYVSLLTAPGKAASQRFWELEKRIRQDEKHPGVLMELRRSTAIWDIAAFLREGIITLEDLDGFSQDLLDAVQYVAQCTMTAECGAAANEGRAVSD